MNDALEIGRLVGQLIDGWTERIEYRKLITKHTESCIEVRSHLSDAAAKHYECQCPQSIEERIESVKQPAIIAQLLTVQIATKSGGGRRTGQTESSPPLDLDIQDLMIRIRDTAHDTHKRLADLYPYERPVTQRRVVIDLRGIAFLAARLIDDYPDAVRDARRELSALVRTARITLGYDMPSRMLQDTVCGTCGGALAVAADAQSAVWCIGTPDAPACGTQYPQWQWLEMLDTTSTETAH